MRNEQQQQCDWQASQSANEQAGEWVRVDLSTYYSYHLARVALTDSFLRSVVSSFSLSLSLSLFSVRVFPYLQQHYLRHIFRYYYWYSWRYQNRIRTACIVVYCFSFVLYCIVWENESKENWIAWVVCKLLIWVRSSMYVCMYVQICGLLRHDWLIDRSIDRSVYHSIIRCVALHCVQTVQCSAVRYRQCRTVLTIRKSQTTARSAEIGHATKIRINIQIKEYPKLLDAILLLLLDATGRYCLYNLRYVTLRYVRSFVRVENWELSTVWVECYRAMTVIMPTDDVDMLFPSCVSRPILMVLLLWADSNWIQ